MASTTRQPDSRIKISVFGTSGAAPPNADVLSAPAVHYYFPASQGSITIGRGGINGVDVALTGVSVLSKVHLRIDASSQPSSPSPQTSQAAPGPASPPPPALDFTVTDLKSANGTSVRPMVICGGVAEAMRALGVVAAAEAAELRSAIQHATMLHSSAAAAASADSSPVSGRLTVEASKILTPPRHSHSYNHSSNAAGSFVTAGTSGIEAASAMLGAIAAGDINNEDNHHHAIHNGEVSPQARLRLVRTELCGNEASLAATTGSDNIFPAVTIVPPTRLAPQVPKPFAHQHQAITIGKHESVAIVITDLLYPTTAPQRVVASNAAGSGHSAAVADATNASTTTSNTAFNGLATVSWNDLFAAACAISELSHVAVEMVSHAHSLRQRLAKAEADLAEAARTNKVLAAATPINPNAASVGRGGGGGSATPIEQSPQHARVGGVAVAAVGAAAAVGTSLGTTLSDGIGAHGSSTATFLAGPSSSDGMDQSPAPPVITSVPQPLPLPPAIPAAVANAAVPSHLAPTLIVPATCHGDAVPATLIASHADGGASPLYSSAAGGGAAHLAATMPDPYADASAAVVVDFNKYTHAGTLLVNTNDVDDSDEDNYNNSSKANVNPNGQNGGRSAAPLDPTLKVVYSDSDAPTDDDEAPPPPAAAAGPANPRQSPSIFSVAAGGRGHSDALNTLLNAVNPPPPAPAPVPALPPAPSPYGLGIAAFANVAATAVTAAVIPPTREASSDPPTDVDEEGDDTAVSTAAPPPPPQKTRTEHAAGGPTLNNNIGQITPLGSGTGGGGASAAPPIVDSLDADDCQPPPAVQPHRNPLLSDFFRKATVPCSEGSSDDEGSDDDAAAPPPTVCKSGKGGAPAAAPSNQHHHHSRAGAAAAKASLSDDDDVAPPPQFAKSGGGAAAAKKRGRSPVAVAAATSDSDATPPMKQRGGGGRADNTTAATAVGTNVISAAAAAAAANPFVHMLSSNAALSVASTSSVQPLSAVGSSLAAVSAAAPSAALAKARAAAPQTQRAAGNTTAKNDSDSGDCTTDDNEAASAPPPRAAAAAAVSANVRIAAASAPTTQRMAPPAGGGDDSDDEDDGSSAPPPPVAASARGDMATPQPQSSAPNTRGGPSNTPSLLPTTPQQQQKQPVGATYSPGMYIPAAAIISKPSSVVPSAENSVNLPMAISAPAPAAPSTAATSVTAAAPVAPAAVWQFKTDLRKSNKNDLAWTSYSDADSAIIEAAFVIYDGTTGNAAKKKVQTAPLNGTYSVNFRDMIQYRNDDETRQRPIRKKP